MNNYCGPERTANRNSFYWSKTMKRQRNRKPTHPNSPPPAGDAGAVRHAAERLLRAFPTGHPHARPTDGGRRCPAGQRYREGHAAEYSKLILSVPGWSKKSWSKKATSVQTGDVLVRLKGAEDLNAAISAAEFEQAAAQKALDDLSKTAETPPEPRWQLVAVQEKLSCAMPATSLTTSRRRSEQSEMTAAEAWCGPKAAWIPPTPPSSLTTITRRTTRPAKTVRKTTTKPRPITTPPSSAWSTKPSYQTAHANLQDAQDDYAIWKDGPDPKDVTVAQARMDNAKAALAAAEAQPGRRRAARPVRRRGQRGQRSRRASGSSPVSPGALPLPADLADLQRGDHRSERDRRGPGESRRRGTGHLRRSARRGGPRRGQKHRP